MSGQHLVNDLRHPEACPLLEALGQADHRNPGPHVRSGLLEHGPEALRGHGHDEHVGDRSRLFERVGRLELGVELGVREIALVRMARAHVFR